MYNVIELLCNKHVSPDTKDIKTRFYVPVIPRYYCYIFIYPKFRCYKTTAAQLLCNEHQSFVERAYEFEEKKLYAAGNICTYKAN